MCVRREAVVLKSLNKQAFRMEWYYVSEIQVSFINPALAWASDELKEECPWPLEGTRLATEEEIEIGMHFELIRLVVITFFVMSCNSN